MSLQFEWDSRKAGSNLKKHGISFEEASTVFADPESLTIRNPYHSSQEVRFITLGFSFKARLLVVVHTDRDDWIRIISARRATKHERNQHEQV